jgi:hypothetical protein
MFLTSHRVQFSFQEQWESQPWKIYGTSKFALASKLQQAARRMDTIADSEIYTNLLQNKLSALSRELNWARLCFQEEGGRFWHSWQTQCSIITLSEANRTLSFPNLHVSFLSKSPSSFTLSKSHSFVKVTNRTYCDMKYFARIRRDSTPGVTIWIPRKSLKFLLLMIHTNLPLYLDNWREKTLSSFFLKNQNFRVCNS